MTKTAHNLSKPVEVLPPESWKTHQEIREAVKPTDRNALRWVASAPRLEIKAVVREFELPRVLAELRLSTSVLRRQYPSRTVQSIYLDTHNARAMMDNISGQLEREKTRFRWYGVDAESCAGTLERKIRRDRLGWKESFALERPVRVLGSSRVVFTESLRSAIPPVVAARVADAIGPSLWIAYEREYYITGDGRVRVTADRNLRSFDLRNAPAISTTHPLPMPRLAVIEFKAALEDEREIDTLLAGVTLLTHRCSKYVMAGSSADGPLPPL